MVQWLMALAALAENPGSIPSTLMEAHTCLWLQLQGLQNPLLESTSTKNTRGAHAYMQAKHASTKK